MSRSVSLCFSLSLCLSLSASLPLLGLSLPVSASLCLSLSLSVSLCLSPAQSSTSLCLVSERDLSKFVTCPSLSLLGVGGMGKKPRRSRPSGRILAALRDMSSSLSHEVPWGAQDHLWPSPGKLLRRVLSKEGGECYSPPPNCGYSRATPRGASHPSIEGCDANLLSPQEEGLWEDNAVKEQHKHRNALYSMIYRMIQAASAGITFANLF